MKATRVVSRGKFRLRNTSVVQTDSNVEARCLRAAVLARHGLPEFAMAAAVFDGCSWSRIRLGLLRWKRRWCSDYTEAEPAAVARTTQQRWRRSSSDSSSGGATSTQQRRRRQARRARETSVGAQQWLRFSGSTMTQDYGFPMRDVVLSRLTTSLSKFWLGFSNPWIQFRK